MTRALSIAALALLHLLLLPLQQTQATQLAQLTQQPPAPSQPLPAQTMSTLLSQRVQRIPNPPMLDRLATTPGANGTIETYVIFVEATQALEAFTLYAPNLPPGQRAPMLTAFHAFGSGWLAIQNYSELLPEAIQRGWYLIAPWQRNTAANANISYASVQSQLHVDAVLDFMLRRYRPDRDRIYGIGFSMGGGNALSYAARHRDRRSGAFAAVVNHTGTAALTDVYSNVNSTVKTIMEQTFGGTPAMVPFEYQRSSLIELDAAAALIPGGRHMGVNLESVPVQSWYNANDRNTYLRTQTVEFDRYLGQLPTSDAELIPVTASIPGCLDQHCWDTVDRAVALNWLATHTLNDSPASGQVLTDRSARWGRFDVQQAQPGSFTSFSFEVDPASNSLDVREPENLAQVAADVWDLGLRADQPLAIKLRSAPSQPVVIQLTGWATVPSVVERNATARPADCSSTSQTSRWCHDPATQSILIVESSANSTSWLIQP